MTFVEDEVERALAERDQARSMAMQLEEQLAEVLRLAEPHFTYHQPIRIGLYSSKYDRQNIGKCQTCRDWWPCRTSVLWDQIRAVTRP